MELSAHGGEIPMPISTSYGTGAHIVHSSSPPNHVMPTATLPPSNGTTVLDHDLPHHHKRVVKYRECLKNHAAAMGGNATDGCGEFMPAGPEGTLDALKCSACNCHRNFHRKEIEGESPSPCDCNYHLKGRKVGKGVLISASEAAYGYPTNSLIPRPPVIMSYNLGVPSESDEHEGGGVLTRAPIVKKRFRTKFTPDQKEKMLSFAEKVGWRIQKQEEEVVQQFCQEIGVKRRVLKVWMHNNKHNFAKKINPPTT
ncbi:unnamed protein product [Victoria cruziana]